MSTTVSNLAETFLSFRKLAKDKPVPGQASLWETHYAGPHRAVLDLCEKGYDGLNVPVEEVFSRYPNVVANIRTVSAGAEAAITASVKRCAITLGVSATPSHHIVMIGQFSSNAWADLFGGVPTCFYALEPIPDLDALVLIAAHETAQTLMLELGYV